MISISLGSYRGGSSLHVEIVKGVDKAGFDKIMLVVSPVVYTKWFYGCL